MNCAEFQEFLPEGFEGGRTAEQDLHLKSCAACSGLVADLELIAREARQLQEHCRAQPASVELNRNRIAAGGHHP